MTKSSVRITDLHVPGSLDGPDAAAFLADCALANLVKEHERGSGDSWLSPQARRVMATSSVYEERSILSAWIPAGDSERLVGRAAVTIPLRDNLRLAEVSIQVHPEVRRRGIGSALYAACLPRIAAASRTTVIGWSDHGWLETDDAAAGTRTEAAQILTPATGSGAIELAAPSASFARKLGFSLEQIERLSVLAVPIPAARLDALTGGRGGASDGYDLTGWHSHCPPDLLEGYAMLRRRMTTEVPQGALDWEEEDWTSERIRLEESELAPEGRELLVTVAREASSGALVGQTVLEYLPAKPDVVFQEDTLVLPGHRGHRLGMRLKLANLERLTAQWPAVRRIYTGNAAENEPMLAINTALGFIPAGCTAIWQKAAAVSDGRGTLRA
ncbi:GNAT family N-acetyltransferase [Paenarthrobacter sp. Z7-10]|uniref:GNAT family N-acetyltransferase n=1 Tax=Paenarthrobacter sp. Z7-10 TaxID=2787635 RepID=UPI0022A97BD2|nr:GNAT family N-acetyltransferase [Paenarthrobacter sp. Z7-10]MCZ2402112.1 GNAT family N-acetyltransferase [Paenarthrobacter sp. Z7-10]